MRQFGVQSSMSACTHTYCPEWERYVKSSWQGRDEATFWQVSLRLAHAPLCLTLSLHSHPSLPLPSPPLFSDLALLPSPFIPDMSAAFFPPSGTDTNYMNYFHGPVLHEETERKSCRTAEPLHIFISQRETCPLKGQIKLHSECKILVKWYLLLWLNNPRSYFVVTFPENFFIKVSLYRTGM